MGKKLLTILQCSVVAFAAGGPSGLAQKTGSPAAAGGASSRPHQAGTQGWKEFVSEGGRFKVSVPADPQQTDVNRFGTTVIHDFVFLLPGAVGRLAYSDDPGYTDDESVLRDAYAESIEAVVRKDRKLVYRKDIRLNGRLGIEYALEEPQSILISRSFMVGRRLYQVSVEKRKRRGASAENLLSEEEARYVNSFSFWEEGEPRAAGFSATGAGHV